ncbi:hypothetical protein J4E83_002011 [Alternaria metachromatica]|uniref:uncharacterized protein n=1 Tax=Alternaria metachromatica TaxID=283354 RepID=UPI0020C506B9|nr:uncharacterized protein J4E83_002011 [Alternaria metachromatica]KAI4634691.1 hypothetical protein J4E83_002011 [Alternaria metachromatica]
MAQSSLIDNFVTGLEYALGTTRTIISLADQWSLECPDGNENADLAEYLRLTGSYPYYHDSYHNLHDFRKLYEEKHGKPPFVHRAMHWQW